jgi:OPA family glycerol-3-phosphate transporter-like MFS transporter
VLADFLGGRALFLLGMAASALCTVLFGLAGGLTAFALAWAANRFVQSMGWGGLVQVAARWFPAAVQATVMGVLSMSYLLGDAAGRWYLGWFVRQGVGWRGIFFLAAATLAAIALASLFTLKGRPGDVGAAEPPPAPGGAFGAAAGERPQRLGQLLAPLARSPAFWLICLLSFGLTAIRETFNFWTPTYLTRAAGLSAGDAAQWSMLFPLTGALAAGLAGAAADRLRGRYGLILVPSLVLLTGALLLLRGLPVAGRPALALAALAAVSFCLIAPYSFCAGVLALGLGGKRGSATAAGLIDSAGYLGGVLSGYPVGAVARRHGWPAVFLALAALAALTALTAAVYSLTRPSTHKAPEPPCPPPPGP